MTTHTLILDHEEVRACISGLQTEISEFDTGDNAKWLLDAQLLIEKLKSYRDNPNRVKRFMLYGITEYYPSGGWYDCMQSFDTFDEAVAHMNADTKGDDDFKRQSHEYYHILDTMTGECTDF